MLRLLSTRRILSKFRKDKDGSTAVEVAMVMPILTVVLFGIFELSMGMYVNTVVEGSLREAARLGLTGQLQAGTSNDQALVDMVNDAAMGMVNLTTDDVSTLVYESFADVGEGEDFIDLNGDGTWTDGEIFTDVNGNAIWDEDLGEAGLGTQGSIVLYTISYNWNFLSGSVVPFLNGTIPMTATIVVQNEPF